MNQFFIPIKAAFAEQTVNILNIDSSLEFLAKDIFRIVTKHSVYDSGYKSLMEVQLNSSNIVPKNLNCIRTVLIDGVLHQKQTFTWLALKHVFHKLVY